MYFRIWGTNFFFQARKVKEFRPGQFRCSGSPYCNLDFEVVRSLQTIQTVQDKLLLSLDTLEVYYCTFYTVRKVLCSVYFWREHLIVELVEGDATRGTTTLVYVQLHISLYTGTVHVLSRVAGIHPLV